MVKKQNMASMKRSESKVANTLPEEKEYYEEMEILELKNDLNDRIESLSQYLSGNDSDDDDDEDDMFSDEETENRVGDCSCIVVFTIPKTKKYAKFQGLLEKGFSDKNYDGQALKEFVRIEIPVIDGKSIGYAIGEYSSREQARLVCTKMSPQTVGKKKKFEVVARPYDKVMQLMGVADEKYEEPSREDFDNEVGTSSTSQKNVQGWLMDKRFRDQFVVRYKNVENNVERHETVVSWAENYDTKPKLIMRQPKDAQDKNGKDAPWCEDYAKWSPGGKYLATMHDKGIKVWGGKNFSRLLRLKHPEVQYIKFSPDEKYILSWVGREKQKVKIFEIASGEEVNKFSFPVPEWFGTTGMTDIIDIPVQFSPDGKFLAYAKELSRKGTRDKLQVISIFEFPSMKLLNGKSIVLKGVKKFSWSPTDNVFAFSTPEDGKFPARIAAVKIEKGKEPVKLREVFLENVKECELKWHPQGHFLMASVTRYPRKRSSKEVTNFEIFRMRDDGVPVETFETNDKVIDFAFESADGVRIAVAQADPTKPSQDTRPTVHIYTMDAVRNGRKFEKILEVEDVQCNKLFWSPMGNFIVFAEVGRQNGALEFYDVEKACSLRKVEHRKCTTVTWDPSGRICATAVTQLMDDDRVQMGLAQSSGYNLWGFMGQHLHVERQIKFYSFEWRPRPPTLLTASDKKNIMKNKKKVWASFIRDDELIQNKEKALEAKDRQEDADDFRKMMWQRLRSSEAPTATITAGAWWSMQGGANAKETTEVIYEEKLDSREEYVA